MIEPFHYEEEILDMSLEQFTMEAIYVILCAIGFTVVCADR